MKLKPLNEYCVLRRLKDAEKTQSGIYIPDIAKGNEDICRAEVLFVPRKDYAVSVGDIVLIDVLRSITHKMEGVEYIFIEEDRLMAVVEE